MVKSARPFACCRPVSRSRGLQSVKTGIGGPADGRAAGSAAADDGPVDRPSPAARRPQLLDGAAPSKSTTT